jgi:hypothetical protein
VPDRVIECHRYLLLCSFHHYCIAGYGPMRRVSAASEHTRPSPPRLCRVRLGDADHPHLRVRSMPSPTAHPSPNVEIPSRCGHIRDRYLGLPIMRNIHSLESSAGRNCSCACIGRPSRLVRSRTGGRRGSRWWIMDATGVRARPLHDLCGGTVVCVVPRGIEVIASTE